MTTYYAARTDRFYDSEVHKRLPDDAVEMTVPMLQALFNAIAQGTRIGDLSTRLATQEYVDEAIQKSRGEIEQTVQEHYITHEQGEERFRFPKRRAGYQVLPSGLIMQWGLVIKPTFSGVTVMYPIAFPHAVLSVCATNAGRPGDGMHSINVVTQGTRDFQLYCDYVSNAPPINSFWFALGY